MNATRGTFVSWRHQVGLTMAIKIFVANSPESIFMQRWLLLWNSERRGKKYYIGIENINIDGSFTSPAAQFKIIN